MLARITEPQKVQGSAVAHSETLATSGAISSIGSGLWIVGKIVGNGMLAIFGHVEGEVHASTVQIGDGAQVEGDIVAAAASRARSMPTASNSISTAVVEGDIHHRSLAIEENAQFEGMSRRDVVDKPSLVPAKRSPALATSTDRERDRSIADTGRPHRSQKTHV